MTVVMAERLPNAETLTLIGVTTTWKRVVVDADGLHTVRRMADDRTRSIRLSAHTNLGRCCTDGTRPNNRLLRAGPINR